MIGVTFHLPEPTLKWAKSRAEEMGITMADFVRRVLDERRLGEPQPRRATR